MHFKAHEEYFASQAAAIQTLLERIRKEVERKVLGASRCISYNMPAFKQRHTFIYFAAFKGHIGVYPPLKHDRGIVEETLSFRGPKGSLSFPYAQDLPLALIGRIAVALANQYAAG